MPALIGFVFGGLFGVGLALSGMALPAKVLAFFDVTGAWDPSLAFVMAGAIALYAPLYRVLVRAAKPVHAGSFVTAVGGRIDARLLVGAATFGVGWGIAGYCPGTALVSAGTGTAEGLTFALAMLAGMLVFEGYDRVVAATRERRAATAPSAG